MDKIIENDVQVSRLNRRQWNWVFVILFIHAAKTLGFYIFLPIAVDAEFAYLPLAKTLLQTGSDFFLQEESVVTGPVSYLWPALFGGENDIAKANTIVKTVNAVAGFVIMWFIYAIGRNLYSRSAGIIAAALFAVCPLLIRWIPTSMGEAPFHLFTLIWIWGLTEIYAEKKWAIPVSALALSLSILTRGVWLYPVIFFIAFSLVWCVFNRGKAKLQFHIALACILGLIIPILYIIKNYVLFGLPSIDTGSGGALFFGTNLMTNGFEPPLLGLFYDHMDNMRTVKGNAEHASVAIQFLKERSLPELMDWYLTKVYWVTLFSEKENLDALVFRVIEMSFAITGFIWGVRKKHYLIIVMGMGVVLQVGQTSLVLYSLRYSGDNLELLLIPLAAVGMAVVFNVRRTPVSGVDVGDMKYQGLFNKYDFQHLIILMGVAVGLLLCQLAFMLYSFSFHYNSDNLGLLLIPLAAVGMAVVFYVRRTAVSGVDVGDIKYRGFFNKYGLQTMVMMALFFVLSYFRPTPAIQLPNYIPVSLLFENKEPRTMTAPLGMMEWDLPGQVFPEHVNILWKITMSVSTATHCQKAYLNFKTIAAPDAFTSPVKLLLNDDGKSHSYFLGTTVMNAHLLPKEAGKLTLKFDCDDNAVINIHDIALIQPHFLKTYFSQFD